ncbi:unnamed protein product [Larinioides sclopetarius]|uniref:Uncharacterized protein n=1 Tax=Larinioides sclopetarius TaxID=280406 RepID=A0AAV1YR30_9ARAC
MRDLYAFALVVGTRGLGLHGKRIAAFSRCRSVERSDLDTKPTGGAAAANVPLRNHWAADSSRDLGGQHQEGTE